MTALLTPPSSFTSKATKVRCASACGSERPEYRLDPGTMMGAVTPGAPADQAGRFAALAMREAARQAREPFVRRFTQQARRGGAEHQHGAIAIQI
jgi:hypothetical protein